MQDSLTIIHGAHARLLEDLLLLEQVSHDDALLFALFVRERDLRAVETRQRQRRPWCWRISRLRIACSRQCAHEEMHTPRLTSYCWIIKSGCRETLNVLVTTLTCLPRLVSPRRGDTHQAHQHAH